MDDVKSESTRETSEADESTCVQQRQRRLCRRDGTQTERRAPIQAALRRRLRDAKLELQSVHRVGSFV